MKKIWRIFKGALKFIFIGIVFILIISILSALISISNCALMINKPSLNMSKNIENKEVKSSQQKISRYCRPMASTFLTFPEWYIVYSSREYAHYIIKNNPSDFPYFRSIEQYWCSYQAVYKIARSYPFNFDDHIMLAVIGLSFSAEYALKGLYENSIGRFTEWLSKNTKTDEDIYAQKVAEEYVDFIPFRPWFEFPFFKSLCDLWHHTSWYGPYMMRKWERKIILSIEYSIKGIYGWLIGVASHATLGTASDAIYAVIKIPNNIANLSDIKIINSFANHLYLISLPYEQPLTNSIVNLAKTNANFLDISCNQAILLTFIVQNTWQNDLTNGTIIFTMPILTDLKLKRISLLVPVNNLLSIVKILGEKNISIEHIYGY